MIPEAAARLADAIATGVGPGVTVDPARPDTRAPPCIWLELEAAGWTPSAAATLEVTHRAVCLVDPALVEPGRSQALGALVDRVIAAGIRVGVAARITSRPGTQLVGDAPTATWEVIVPQAVARCDLAPLPLEGPARASDETETVDV